MTVSQDPVVTLCQVALAVAAVWAVLVMLHVLAEVWRARREGRRAQLRRVLLACCGLALAAPAPAAVADDGAAAGTATPSAPAHLAGLPMPDRPLGPEVHPRTVVVSAGDCLWHLAAAGLGPEAGPAEIAARWRAIYRLNRAVIGADPDVISPGQRLVLPPDPSTRSRSHP
jgi:nucleoid-associated protein YgaU